MLIGRKHFLAFFVVVHANSMKTITAAEVA